MDIPLCFSAISHGNNLTQTSKMVSTLKCLLLNEGIIEEQFLSFKS